ncbi:hypothetical protein EVAR_79581_1 [Eumeta japonica]|uniref:Uncharacterized protein n=1 Tax=Eumeta variegata TaxID=151549 RepID=A0A4C1UFP3_EUMVA|nr:hypothetical protein EVAR_79581_1 [Eumeta japonica]
MSPARRRRRRYGPQSLESSPLTALIMRPRAIARLRLDSAADGSSSESGPFESSRRDSRSLSPPEAEVSEAVTNGVYHFKMHDVSVTDQVCVVSDRINCVALAKSAFIQARVEWCNASCQTSAETTQFLEGNKMELTSHLLYSSNMAPKDFYLFPSVENKLRGQRFSSSEEAVDAFKKHVLVIPQLK